MKKSISSIIHINVTEFYSSIAIVKEQSLREKAFVIAQDNSQKATILSSSLHARKEGVMRGMSIALAKQLVPHLIILKPDEDAYSKAQNIMQEIASEYTPSIQNESKGHLYLNMEGTFRLFGPPLDSSVHICREIKDKLNLQPAIAVATNRLVAKIATRATRPHGITHIPEGEEKEFLSSQDISFLPGLSQSTMNLLEISGMHYIGNIASLNDDEAIAFLGKNGIMLRNRALGIDNNDFDTTSIKKNSIEAHVDFAHSTHLITTLRAGIIEAMIELGGKMRASSLGASRIELIIYWVDKKITQASITSKKILIWELDLYSTIDALIEKGLNRRLEMIAVDVKASSLSPYIEQGILFEAESREKVKLVQQSIDTLRKKFGNHTIFSASALYHG